MLVFSSMHITTACSGGFMYADDVADLVDELRVLGQFERVGQSHGFNPEGIPYRCGATCVAKHDACIQHDDEGIESRA
jgi:hypothetical protein